MITDKQRRRIERGRHLQVLVRRYGGYDRIPPAVWDWHDRIMADYHAERRTQLLMEITQNGAARGGAARAKPKLRATQPKERDRDHG